MINRKPEGYKDLLVYQKAAELQRLTVELTNLFPKTKNLLSLKDQMDRSGRSGTKNIIEGWKRNTTSEYFRFLGYAIASIEELKDDFADMATGLYKELMIIKGLMGVMGRMGKTGKAAVIDAGPPVTPFSSSELEKLQFYPLDTTLPPAAQLYLRCKEILMMLHKLQKSLDAKMDKEHTKPMAQKLRSRLNEQANYQKWLLQETKKMGLAQLENGRFVKKENADPS